MDDLLQYTFGGLTNGSVYALVALGLTIVFNVSGVVNFAQGSYAVLGALTASSLHGLGVPLLLSVPLAVIAVSMVSLAVYLLTVAPIPRATHFTSIAVTLGLAIVLDKIAQFIWGTEFYTLPPFFNFSTVELAGASIDAQTIVVLAVSISLMLLMTAYFKHTRSGQAALACSENREAAGLVGINVNRIALRAYVIGAALGAVAGIVILPLTTMSNSSGPILTIKGFAACVLGGFGSGVGSVIGGLLLGLVEAYGITVLPSGYQALIAYSVVVIILLLRPGGILGTRALKI
jgi:branched-chain amino acid transport system permease protein